MRTDVGAGGDLALRAPCRHSAGVVHSPPRRRLLVLAVLVPLLVLFSDPRPASADIGIPGWATFAVGAAAAVQGVTVNAAAAVGSVAYASVGAVGSAVATGGTAAVSAAELAALEASYALPALGTVGGVAAGAGVCAGTAGIACVAGGVLAAGVAGYGLYKFFTGNSGEPAPNADVPAQPASPSFGGGTWSSGTSQPAPVLSEGGRCATFAANPSIGSAVTTFCVSDPAYNTPAPWTVTLTMSAGGPCYCTPYALFTENTGVDGNFNGEYYGTAVKVWTHREPAGGAPYTAAAAGAGGIFNHQGGTYAGYTLPGSAVTYRPPTPAGPAPAPARQLVTSRDCVDASGSVTVVTGIGPSYVEGVGVDAVAATPACPAGTSARKTTVTAKPVAAGSVPDKPVVTYTAPPGAAPGVEPAPVELVHLLPGGATEPCAVTPSPCAGWFASPTKTSNFQCMQGATVLPLSDCDGLARKYDPLPSPPRKAGSNCEGGDFSLNPVSWVVVPLRCLFIPDPVKTQAQLTTVQAKWSATGPGAVLGAFARVAGTVTGLGAHPPADCNGPEVAFNLPGSFADRHVSLHPLSACSPISQYVLSVMMPLSTAFVYLGAMWTGGRLVARAFGVEVAPQHADAAA